MGNSHFNNLPIFQLSVGNNMTTKSLRVRVVRNDKKIFKEKSNSFFLQITIYSNHKRLCKPVYDILEPELKWIDMEPNKTLNKDQTGVPVVHSSKLLAVKS